MNTNPTDRRDRLMAALSAAEQITAASKALPYDLTVRPGSVDIFAHAAPDDVPVFASQFALELSLAPQHGGDRPLMEARGSFGDVSVRVWALGSVEEWGRYREVAAAALVSLPAAWRVAGAA